MPAMIRLGTVINANRPINTATMTSAYFRTLPLRGRPIGDRPEPLHSGHLPVPEQCGHAASDELKCGLIPVPLHSSHFPEASQNEHSPSFHITMPQISQDWALYAQSQAKSTMMSTHRRYRKMMPGSRSPECAVRWRKDYLLLSASTPGSFLPSRNSSEAPPPVEM